MKKPLIESLFGKSPESKAKRRLIRHGTFSLALILTSVAITAGLSPTYAFVGNFMVLGMAVVHAMYGRLSLRIGQLEGKQ